MRSRIKDKVRPKINPLLSELDQIRSTLERSGASANQYHVKILPVKLKALERLSEIADTLFLWSEGMVYENELQHELSLQHRVTDARVNIYNRKSMQTPDLVYNTQLSIQDKEYLTQALQGLTSLVLHLPRPRTDYFASKHELLNLIGYISISAKSLDGMLNS